MAYNFDQLKKQLKQTLAHLKKEIATLRTGQASIQLLDPVIVEAYGSKLKLNEVASITVADPTLLVVKPWDQNLLEAIEKAISSADLNLHPIVDKELVRVPVPALTEERRKEMVKILHQKLEDGRVLIRNIRTKSKQDIEAQEGAPGVSEDDIALALENLEDHIKSAIEKLEELGETKEQDLLKL
ncbi:MAG: ribosome recycling factor [Candidatus Pacebacteria bacterium]|nr:ribosome recycling factor [Candidatus Paceibacterota bacterium]